LKNLPITFLAIVLQAIGIAPNVAVTTFRRTAAASSAKHLGRSSNQPDVAGMMQFLLLLSRAIPLSLAVNGVYRHSDDPEQILIPESNGLRILETSYRRTSISGTTFSGKKCLSVTIFHAI
jgi:hypothetical protein